MKMFNSPSSRTPARLYIPTPEELICYRVKK
jgi:hypothetical protein